MASAGRKERGGSERVGREKCSRIPIQKLTMRSTPLFPFYLLKVLPGVPDCFFGATQHAIPLLSGSGALFASAVLSPVLHALAMAAPLALTPSLEDEDKKDYDLSSTEEPLKQTRLNKYFGTSHVVQPRTLKSRHLVLISIGGTIGTGKLSSSPTRFVRNEED